LRGSASSAPAGSSKSPSISGDGLDPCIDASMRFAHGRDSGREQLSCPGGHVGITWAGCRSVQTYKASFVDNGRGSEIILRFFFVSRSASVADFTRPHIYAVDVACSLAPAALGHFFFFFSSNPRAMGPAAALGHYFVGVSLA